MSVNNFRASDIHECDKYMVHTILDWDKRSMYDVGLQAYLRLAIRKKGT